MLAAPLASAFPLNAGALGTDLAAAAPGAGLASALPAPPAGLAVPWAALVGAMAGPAAACLDGNAWPRARAAASDTLWWMRWRALWGALPGLHGCPLAPGTALDAGVALDGCLFSAVGLLNDDTAAGRRVPAAVPLAALRASSGSSALCRNCATFLPFCSHCCPFTAGCGQRTAGSLKVRQQRAGHMPAHLCRSWRLSRPHRSLLGLCAGHGRMLRCAALHRCRMGRR